MANYPYASVRRAIANKLMGPKNSWELVDDASDWTVYKEPRNYSENPPCSYHVIKFTQRTQDSSYNFSLDISKVTAEPLNEIFKSFFVDDCTNPPCNITVTFYFACITDQVDLSMSKDDCQKNDNNCIEFRCFNLHHPANESVPFPKFQDSMDKNSKVTKKFAIRILENQEDAELTLSPYPVQYQSTDIKQHTTNHIQLTKKDLCEANEAFKKETHDQSDYERLLTRSFEDFLSTNAPLQQWFDPNKSHVPSFTFPNGEECKCCDGELSGDTKDKRKSCLKQCFKEKYFEKIMPFNDPAKPNFKTKFFPEEPEVRKCSYCGVKESQLRYMLTVRSGRGERLEYDRVISRDRNGNKVDYCIENVELACYWCNNAKTDTFSPYEFKGIARAINQIWNVKLKAENSTETICFYENDSIWSIKNAGDLKRQIKV